jgi:pimeloyl-ACP methyl ester carboxylesterase
MARRHLVCAIAFVLALVAQPIAPRAQQTPEASTAIAVRSATADGASVQYLTAGHGPAIVLLHGYAETSRMWRPLMPRLAATHTVIAPDLPGIGGSAIPADGLDMTHAAARIHALVKGLGVNKAAVVGHDIGLMVAYAYAAQFPDDVDRLVLMDAFLPGVEGWEAIYNNPAIWHFRFNGPRRRPLFAVVSGRTSSTSGTTSPPIRLDRSPKPIARPTPLPMPGLGGCVPGGRTSCRFSGQPETSRASHKRSSPCRFCPSVERRQTARPSPSRFSSWPRMPDR